MTKNLPANAEDVGSIPGLGRSPGEGEWLLTPIFLPWKSHGQRCLAGRSPWGGKSISHGLVTKQQTIKTVYILKGNLFMCT